jgi:hypothetical protein
LVPILKRGAKAAFKSAPGKTVIYYAKKSAISAAGAVASDVLKGRNPKENAKINLKD